MRLTLSIASLGRPERTRRAIRAVCAQDCTGWEALIVGDGCPVMQEIIDSKEFVSEQERLAKQGNLLVLENLDKNYGGCGYEIINRNIQRANGKYFILAANDDVLLPNHFSNYLSAIEGDDAIGFAYFDSRLDFCNSIRESRLEYGGIGHSEIIVRTDLARMMPPHGPDYGHDWVFIQHLINSGTISRKAVGFPPTYCVKGTPVCREQGID